MRTPIGRAHPRLDTRGLLSKTVCNWGEFKKVTAKLRGSQRSIPASQISAQFASDARTAALQLNFCTKSVQAHYVSLVCNNATLSIFKLIKLLSNYLSL